LCDNCPFIYFKWEIIVLALIGAITLCRLLSGGAGGRLLSRGAKEGVLLRQ
jgi:hypothetical protein